MARVPPPEHTRWKKGQSGNPSGGRKGVLTNDEVKALLGKYARLTLDELTAKLEDPKTTMVERMIGATVMKAVKSGDYGAFEFLLSRSFGKVPNVNENHNTNYDKDFEDAPRENILDLLRKQA